VNQPFESELREHRNTIYLLLRALGEIGRPLLLRSDLHECIQAFLQEQDDDALARSEIVTSLATAQEAVVVGPNVFFALRPRIAQWKYLHVHAEAVLAREVDVKEYLATRERLVEGTHAGTDWALEVDFGAFERNFPRLTQSSSIGRGVEFLNRHLAGRLFANRGGPGPELLFDFLRVHQVRGRQLMVNAIITSRAQLAEALRRAREILEEQDPQARWDDVAAHLRPLGFEPGWGGSVEQISRSMELLADIFEAPSPENLERFLARLPMIFNVAIVSPHGWFAQSGVLGRPDTGGQVVYILDQVRALEQQMLRTIADQGLDVQPQIVVLTRLIPEAEGTSCDERSESILGTEHARILRVPFRDENGEVLPHWISRFQVWPYLERFAQECEGLVAAEMDGRPDLVIGNYSDGNLVATLLSRRLGVTQCNIAHALEKTKYLHSDLYWRDHEAEHHFAAQYTADLIAMNAADFVITSTYQEIAGTRSSVGQYESYDHYSLPGLYRVRRGIDCFDPKFNIVSPGANADVFFPSWESDRRIEDLHTTIEELIHGEETDHTFGRLHDRERPLLLSLSRLDRIKNVSSLVQWYAESEDLRERADLVIVGGHLDPAHSDDEEEREQIERIHALVHEHDLRDHLRWIAVNAEKNLVGELYRYVADRRGAFVQPALFEAFGLTVIEAMVSGLPVFATRYGGPLEIIEDGKNGFHIDPNHGDAVANRLAEFLHRCSEDPEYWERIARAAHARVQERYTWKLYAERLLSLSRIYGFWKYVTNIDRDQTRCYLDMFYGLMYRPLSQAVLPTNRSPLEG
jgi:sucrose synthase